MTQSPSLLRRSLGILHSCLGIILVPYLLDIIYARLVHLGWGPLAIAVVIPLKIYVFSGIYGALVEIVSGEEVVLRFRNVKKNAKEFWKIYLLFSAMPFLFHLVITLASLNALNIPIYIFYAHFNIFIMYGLALYVFRKKYLLQSQLPKRSLSMTGAMASGFLALYVASIAIFDLPYFYDPDTIDMTRYTLPVFYYLTFGIFIYIISVLQSAHPEVEEKFVGVPEVYLINPAGGGLLLHLFSLVVPFNSPVFVVIRALTPKKYKFREFNQLPWQKRYFTGGKLVAITCYSSNSCDCYHLAQEFRRRGSKVVLGGPHITFLPEEALEYCDSVVTGELENVWEEVVADYENNRMKKQYSGAPVKDCHDLIHQELLNSPPEVIKDFLETSRGCKFKCHFCSVPAVSGGSLRTKPVFDVVELIEKIRHKYKTIRFIDNNIYSDPAYTKELFKALKPLNVKWSTQCTIDIAKNDELLKLARESGCVGLLIGFEISENSAEKQVGGKLGMAQKYKEYAKKIRDVGIRIKAHFIFGFESDKLKDLLTYWKFCYAIKPDMSALSILTPFPGTKVYYDMVRSDCVSNLNWKHYGCHAMVFEHRNMNSRLLAVFWPFIYTLFTLTTTRLGFVVLVVLVGLGAGVIIPR